MFLMIDNQKIVLDKHGFLSDYRLWNEALAMAFAEQEAITLNAEHWAVLGLARDFYQEYQHIPPLRMFIKVIATKLDPDRANSLYLYKLFPDTPVRKICRIAGLPKPRHCL